MKKAIVIGAGFAGISAASFLAKAGWEVTVMEKLSSPGGRARQFTAEGFTFDMGPSWYWMPEVFERYFNFFGYKTSDFYTLERLDPSYRVYWPASLMEIPAGYAQLQELFEQLEPGSAGKLDSFMAEAAYKYDTGINKLVQKPGLSVKEFMDWDLARGVLKLDVFTSMRKHVHKFFKNPKIRQLLEFPVLFLGALPQNIPALYSLMNYADIKLGTWYPQGGMYEIVKAMEKIALSNGVKFMFDMPVKGLTIKNNGITGVQVMQNGNEHFFAADVVIGAADYHFIENQILPEAYRTYSEKYWNNRVMAPSCLIYYVGLNKKLKNIRHHNLFFDVDFEQHGMQIYSNPAWPAEPLFYVCVPSVTDESVAPPGCENLFFLVPVAAGLEGDDEELREIFFKKIINRFEERIGDTITGNIIYKRSYANSDFVNDYNAFKGNAYGLANTLKQTAILKPSMRSKKITNLYYTGQLTVPGPGVPPSLISGEVVAREVEKNFGLN